MRKKKNFKKDFYFYCTSTDLSSNLPKPNTRTNIRYGYGTEYSYRTRTMLKTVLNALLSKIFFLKFLFKILY